MLTSQLTTLLGHAHVTLKPVVDLAEAVRVTAYEHPEHLAERIWLLTGGDVFPYARATSRPGLDLDHPTP